MRVPGILIAFCSIAILSASNAVAQFAAPPPTVPVPVVPGRPLPPVGETTISDSRQLINNKDTYFLGHVEMQRGDTTIFADDVRVFGDTNKAIATGNVVFSQGNNRIAAERAEFDT